MLAFRMAEHVYYAGRACSYSRRGIRAPKRGIRNTPDIYFSLINFTLSKTSHYRHDCQRISKHVPVSGSTAVSAIADIFVHTFPVEIGPAAPIRYATSSSVYCLPLLVALQSVASISLSPSRASIYSCPRCYRGCRVCRRTYTNFRFSTTCFGISITPGGQSRSLIVFVRRFITLQSFCSIPLLPASVLKQKSAMPTVVYASLSIRD
ncbi:hypothetical protein F5Y01DRAFT_45316 [Xylaria sp. FL0043]|nr:hypothetical protein F5Y01DRAFT_45316 [Xylaria sp. FL0043]